MESLHVVEQTAPPPPHKKSFLDVLFGRALSSEEDSRERVGPVTGVPVFGLDALSSTAYGPEAALTVLLPLGVAGAAYIFPISLTILVLLTIVYFSYRQTIAAYPNGGGSYTVATENLGTRLGLLAGAALMLDYILNVAVGISAGVGAIVSAFPVLEPHTLSFCLAILVVLTLVNLRGVRDAGLLFMVPTYIFVGSIGGIIVVGLWRVVATGGHPVAVKPPHHAAAALSAVGAWLLIKAFAGGCTAMTGVEAVSNGVQVFSEPRVQKARLTLTIIIGTLLLLLGGVTYLAKAYRIVATVPGQPGYESVLSQLTGAVAGRGFLYFLTMGSVLAVLCLSANTSFADFPRLCRAIAENGYLPYPFTVRGRRLVFSFGVNSLAIFAGLLLIVFKGVTDRLIPLFAVGAFLAFTLSQAGMVMHWRKNRGRGWRTSMLVNGFGALATGLTTGVVIVAKFAEGAWITVLAIPALILLMTGIRQHYTRIQRETVLHTPATLKGVGTPIVVLPLEQWNKIGEKALRFAYMISQEVIVLHIASEDEPAEKNTNDLARDWAQYVEKPAVHAGLKPPQLVMLHSPYRLVMTPILQYVLKLERESGQRTIAVLVPELVEPHWFYYVLHNQRAAVLKFMLYLKGTGRIVVVNVPWYL